MLICSPSLACRCGPSDLPILAQPVFALDLVLGQAADARQGPAAVGDRDRDHDLVGARRIGDRTSMPSKWLRTKAASLWPSGMSSGAARPARFLDDGISAAPFRAPCAPARRASDAGSRRHARARRSRRRPPPCRSSRPCAGSMPSAATARSASRPPSSSPMSISSVRSSTIAARRTGSRSPRGRRAARRRRHLTAHLATASPRPPSRACGSSPSSEPVLALDLARLEAADAGMNARARRHDQRQHDLVGARRIGTPTSIASKWLRT